MELIGVSSIFYDGIILAIIISSFPLLTAFIVGLLISILQVATQIQEQTISIVAKISSVIFIFFIFGSWMGSQMIDFFITTMSNIEMVK